MRLPRMTTLIITIALLSGVSSFAGVNRWTSSGPAGASIKALVVDPVDSRVVYAVTNGAGIFRSTAAGEPQWQRVNVDVAESVITALAIDPAAPEVLYAGTPTGVWRSGDHGEHWAAVADSSGEWVYAIAIDAKRRRVFVGTDSGVLTSGTDEQSWRAIPQLRHGTTSIAIGSDGTIYVASWIGVYMSKDGGDTWTSAFLSNETVAVASDPDNPTVYAAKPDQVQTSIDSGRTWRPLPVLDAKVKSLLAVRGGFYAATDRGVYLYDNATSKWARVGSLTRNVAAVAFAQSTPPRIYAGTQAGVLTAFETDSQWQPANSGMNAAFVFDVATVDDDVVYVTTYEGLFQSTDGAATWGRVPGLDELLPHSGGTAGGGCCTAAPIATSGAKTIYVASQKGVHRSTDQALTWEVVTPRVASKLAVSSDATLYAAFSDDLAKSTDGGKTWRSASNGLFETSYAAYSWMYVGVNSIETDVDDPAVVYTANGEATYKTSNGGESWKRIYGQPSPKNIPVYAVAGRGPIAHLAAYYGLVTSVDGGTTWSSGRLTEERVLALALDPLDSSRSYAGTASGRVYRSDDFGDEWILFGDALPGAPGVLRLAVSDSGDRIYAATSGGVFVYQIGATVAAERLPDDPLRLPSLMRQLLTAAGTPRNALTATPSTVAFVLPSVGTVRGSQGIVFRTDVTLSNGRSTEQDVLVAWLPQGNSAGSVVPTFRITLPASVDDRGGTLTISDIADELALSGLGSMAVFAVDREGHLDDAADIDGSARVRSPSSCGSGSVSQSVPAIASFGTQRQARALGLRHESAYRTNVGIVNIGEFTREFTIVVAGERDSKRFTVSVPPFSMIQEALPDANYGPLSVTVISDQGGTPWAAYGSSVDNASGDSWSSVAAPRPDR